MKTKNLKKRGAGLVLFAFFLIPYASSLLRAADSKIGTEGAAFMKIPTGSPRAQALGNNGVSLMEGGEAMGINPAGIASAQMRELSFSHLSWIQEYGGQYASYVHPIGQSVVGINYAYYGIKNFDVRDSEGKPQYSTDVKVRNSYATFTIAKGFFLEKFLVGVSAKEVMEDNYTKEYKNLVFDFGAILRLGRKLSLGWSGHNMSGKKKHDRQDHGQPGDERDLRLLLRRRAVQRAGAWLRHGLRLYPGALRRPGQGEPAGGAGAVLTICV